MPAGSGWEVYIPQDMAYGEREQGDIKPFAVLIFKIELLEANTKR
jgi:FKBP-type peptidyl-prolyl cis-trans isomerase FklB